MMKSNLLLNFLLCSVIKNAFYISNATPLPTLQKKLLAQFLEKTRTPLPRFLSRGSYSRFKNPNWCLSVMSTPQEVSLRSNKIENNNFVSVLNFDNVY
jgi:hypothetical protein